jgi:hypothetical protein
MRLLGFASGLFRVRAITAVKADAAKASRGWSAACIIRRVICGAFLVLLVASGAPPVKHALAGPFPDKIDAFHSSNAYLQVVTGSAGASQRLIDVMASLPSEKPLLIFSREKDSGSRMLAMVLAYLAWPREIQFETVSSARCDEQLAKIAPDSVGGVAFCDLASPSWVPGGLPLGQNGRLITLAAHEEKSR